MAIEWIKYCWSHICNIHAPIIWAAGTYNYTCVITDACGRTATTPQKTFTIVADPTAAISGSATVCQGTNVTLSAVISGGTGTYSYQWQSSSLIGGPYNNIIGATSINYTPNTSSPGRLIIW
jgi:hypothetical protein